MSLAAQLRRTPLAGLNLDPERCLRRNRIAASKGFDAVPVRLHHRPPPAARGGRAVTAAGTLPGDPAEALGRINRILGRESDPLAESDVYLVYPEAANTNFIVDRHMFLGDSTLRRIASRAAEGFAFMNSHRTGGLSASSELPYGRTFAGRYELHSGPDGRPTGRTLLGVYMLRGQRPNGDSGPTTDDLYRGIAGGTIQDVSMGLYGGRRVCDVCGNDLKARDAETGDYLCQHAPGSHRAMKPEEVELQESRGVPKGVATYTLEDSEPGEVSAVFNGAVPGAGFSKAIALARSGDLSESDMEELALAYAPLLGGLRFSRLAAAGAGEDVEDEAVRDDPDADREATEARFEASTRRWASRSVGLTASPAGPDAAPATSPGLDSATERWAARQHGVPAPEPPRAGGPASPFVVLPPHLLPEPAGPDAECEAEALALAAERRGEAVYAEFGAEVAHLDAHIRRLPGTDPEWGRSVVRANRRRTRVLALLGGRAGAMPMSDGEALALAKIAHGGPGGLAALLGDVALALRSEAPEPPRVDEKLKQLAWRFKQGEVTVGRYVAEAAALLGDRRRLAARSEALGRFLRAVPPALAVDVGRVLGEPAAVASAAAEALLLARPVPATPDLDADLADLDGRLEALGLDPESPDARRVGSALQGRRRELVAARSRVRADHRRSVAAAAASLVDRAMAGEVGAWVDLHALARDRADSFPPGLAARLADCGLDAARSAGPEGLALLLE